MNVYEALLQRGMIPVGEDIDMSPRDAADSIFRMGYLPMLHAADAPAKCRMMLKGHCNVAEIDFSERGASKAIREIRETAPEMTVGAYAADADQCGKAIEAGASFVVLGAQDPSAAELCREAGIPVILSCESVDGIRFAHENGIGIVKVCWQEDTDNIARLMSLAASEPVDLKFIVCVGNRTAPIGQLVSAPFVLAVRGTWLKDLDASEPYAEDRVITLCEDLLTEVLGYQMWHIGINTADANSARVLGDQIHDMFRLKLRDNGISSRFAGTGIEVMKRMYLGANGHFAMRTNNADRAILHLKEQGYDMDWETKFPAHGPISTIYMKDVNLGGFAVHLLQRAFPQ